MKITLQSDAKKICISVLKETRIDEIIAKSEFKLTRPDVYKRQKYRKTRCRQALPQRQLQQALFRL